MDLCVLHIRQEKSNGCALIPRCVWRSRRRSANPRSISVLVNGLYEELAEPQFTQERASRPTVAGEETSLVVECHGGAKGGRRGPAG